MVFKKGQSGNPSGRPKGSDYLKRLNDALTTVELKRGKHFLEHFVEKAYENPTMAVALLKKIAPDLVKGEGFDTNVFLNTVQQVIEDARRTTNRITDTTAVHDRSSTGLGEES